MAQAVLGTMRLRFAERNGLIPEGAWAPVWVVNFPLVEWNEGEGRWDSTHHPFTAPRPEDLDRLESDPGAVLSQAYDVVLNGLEIGGGSIRIHDRDAQERVFSLIGLSAEEAEAKFGFLLTALRMGAPPHGGIALGLDRTRDAAGRRAVDPRRDRLPEDRHRRRPAHGRPGPGGRAAAARAGREAGLSRPASGLGLRRRRAGGRRCAGRTRG